MVNEGGWAAGMEHSVIGFKRILTTLMLVSTPLVSANPISLSQDTLALNVMNLASTFRASSADQTAQIGTASWYSKRDPAINLRTANGEIFNDQLATCASWKFAFGTLLEVKNLANDRSVICRVNDRGPAKRLNRVIDLTKGAFKHIANPKEGLVKVSVRELEIEDALVRLS